MTAGWSGFAGSMPEAAERTIDEVIWADDAGLHLLGDLQPERGYYAVGSKQHRLHLCKA